MKAKKEILINDGRTRVNIDLLPETVEIIKRYAAMYGTKPKRVMQDSIDGCAEAMLAEHPELASNSKKEDMSLKNIQIPIYSDGKLVSKSK